MAADAIPQTTRLNNLSMREDSTHVMSAQSWSSKRQLRGDDQGAPVNKLESWLGRDSKSDEHLVRNLVRSRAFHDIRHHTLREPLLPQVHFNLPDDPGTTTTAAAASAETTSKRNLVIAAVEEQCSFTDAQCSRGHAHRGQELFQVQRPSCTVSAQERGCGRTAQLLQERHHKEYRFCKQAPRTHLRCASELGNP